MQTVCGFLLKQNFELNLIHYTVLCGRWESYPREFAKCRRCRKAKYCGKECQSTAWSEGHRFWCSAKDGDEDTVEQVHGDQATVIPVVSDGAGATDDGGDVVAMTAGGTITGRTERRAERERERHVRERTLATIALGAESTQAARAAANPFRTVLNSPHGTVGVNQSAIFGPSSTTNGPLPGGSNVTSRAQVVPSQTRAPVPNLALLRNFYVRAPNAAAAVTDANVNAQNLSIYNNFAPAHSAHLIPDQGGRRRAETISGAASVVNTNADSSAASHAHVRPGVDRYFSQPNGASSRAGNERIAAAGTDVGSSRGRRRADNAPRSPVGDHDMVLG